MRLASRTAANSCYWPPALATCTIYEPATCWLWFQAPATFGLPLLRAYQLRAVAMCFELAPVRELVLLRTTGWVHRGIEHCGFKLRAAYCGTSGIVASCSVLRGVRIPARYSLVLLPLATCKRLPILATCCSDHLPLALAAKSTRPLLQALWLRAIRLHASCFATFPFPQPHPFLTGIPLTTAPRCHARRCHTQFITHEDEQAELSQEELSESRKRGEGKRRVAGCFCTHCTGDVLYV